MTHGCRFVRTDWDSPFRGIVVFACLFLALGFAAAPVAAGGGGEIPVRLDRTGLDRANTDRADLDKNMAARRAGDWCPGDKGKDDAPRTWVMVHGGVLTENGFTEWFWKGDMADHFMAGASVVRELGPMGDYVPFLDFKGLTMEMEGMLDYHWGPFRGQEQEYWEATLTWNARLALPWGFPIPSSIGFGAGPSYATVKPRHEAEINGRTYELLNYLMLDFTWPAGIPNLELVFRVHHRSGIFGLIENVKGGSNYLLGGLKYEF